MALMTTVVKVAPFVRVTNESSEPTFWRISIKGVVGKKIVEET